MSTVDFVVHHRWNAPAHVHAVTTTRAGGVSTGSYATLNLGDHVGDDPQAVRHNRAQVRTGLGLPAEPLWLRQVHGATIVNASDAITGTAADGVWTDRQGVVCAILTADCLPIFLSNRAGTRVALLHAGWRGLAAGIIGAGIGALAREGEVLVAHLGPAIGPESYEVGDEVRAAFVTHDPRAHRAFRAHRAGRWWMDIYELARNQLRELGVAEVSGGERCTLHEHETYYSHRRDGISGRMASLIWME